MKYSSRFLLRCYEKMLLIRLCEESFIEPILNKEIRCPVHLYSGEEAIAVGLSANLIERDYIFGTHRSHGHYLAKGGDLRTLVAEIYCKESGCSHGRGGSMHITAQEKGMIGSAPIVAGTISLALGAALACSIRKEKRVAVSYFGDGAAGEGVLYESMNFASLHKLPIIFACENNLYSTHLSIKECRVSDDIYDIAKPFGIKTAKVDGNDVVKVYEASKEAVNICRKGEGPYFLEFKTYRLRGHVGPNDNIQGTQTDIRPAKEIELWKKRDPIKRMERFLLRNKITSAKKIATLKSKITKEVKMAHEFARESPYPQNTEMANYVFK